MIQYLQREVSVSPFAVLIKGRINVFIQPRRVLRDKRSELFNDICAVFVEAASKVVLCALTSSDLGIHSV